MTELREQIARVIDPSSWRVFDSELERVKRHHPNGGYDPDNFKDRISLAQADRIIALLPASQAVREEAVDELVKALVLAEDVLSRSPFSNQIWPNGMHPNTGIEQIRAALAPFIAGEG